MFLAAREPIPAAALTTATIQNSSRDQQPENPTAKGSKNIKLLHYQLENETVAGSSDKK